MISMNMSKKILILLAVSFMLFSKNVYANCNSYNSGSSPGFEFGMDLEDVVGCTNDSKCYWDTSKNKCKEFTGCSSLDESKICQNKSCLWTGSECVDSEVAKNPCNEEDILKALRVIGYILFIVKFLVPLIIIGYGTFDIFKSVADKDEKSLSKQLKQLGIRVITGLVIFLIPNIVDAAFSISDKLNIIETSQYKKCSKCILNPASCKIDVD